MPAILALGRLRQEHCYALKTGLGHTLKPCVKNNFYTNIKDLFHLIPIVLLIVISFFPEALSQK